MKLEMCRSKALAPASSPAGLGSFSARESSTGTSASAAVPNARLLGYFHGIDFAFDPSLPLHSSKPRSLVTTAHVFPFNEL